jgi:hypothetical protein
MLIILLASSALWRAQAFSIDGSISRHGGQVDLHRVQRHDAHDAKARFQYPWLAFVCGLNLRLGRHHGQSLTTIEVRHEKIGLPTYALTTDRG